MANPRRMVVCERLLDLAIRRCLATMAFVISLIMLMVVPATADSSGKLRVVTTIKPLHSLTTAVMQGVGVPHLLIVGAGSPHDYRLRPSDTRALHAADVIFRISPQVEPFLNKTANNLPASVQHVTIIDIDGLKLLPVRTGVKFEAHEHEDHDGHEVNAKIHHDDHGDHDVHDGHVWLDPANAKLIVKHIATVLAKQSPDHAAVFQANAVRVVSEIEALEKDIATRMGKLKASRFIVFHDAFQYFERSFGLQASGAISVRPDTPLGAKRLLGLRQTTKDLQVTCVFSEPQFRARVIDTVIEGLDVRKGVLDPLGATLPPGAEHYMQLMRNLSDGFEACLGKVP